MHRTQSGFQMAEVLNPTNGYRGALEAKGQKPKNHMQANRQMILKKQEQVKQRQEEAQQTKDRFVPSKYRNVESKLSQNLRSRPPTAQRPGETPQMSKTAMKTQVVFGKGFDGDTPPDVKHQFSHRGNSLSGPAKAEPFAAQQRSQAQLTTNALARFNTQRKSSVEVRRPVDPEVVVQANRKELFEDARQENIENVQYTANENVDRGAKGHKDYGKVPKYLQQYKVEADQLAQKRAELKAKSMLPPGTRQIDEAERVKTLEELMSTKRELNSMLQGMPISMRSENLRHRKRELEERLSTIEKAITTFSRRVVYVQE